LWPAFEMHRGPLRVLGSPLPGSSTMALGPLFAADADVPETLGAFLTHDLFRRHAYFACRTVERTHAIDLAPFGFSPVRALETYWIDLREPEQALWQSLKSECRSRIRKAEKLGIETRIEDTADFIPDFWRMSLETFARSAARPTYDEAMVREVWRRFQPAGRLLVLSAFLRGERVSTLVLPHDDRTIIYWGGASAQAHRDLPTGNLLHWRAILEARGRGLIGYDMISTTGGPGRFKKTFGPKLVSIGRDWERSPSAWLAFLKRRYEWLARKRLGLRRAA
ncbi:MAG: GNAT family N-acetyltransferase, partial [Candidatus Binatia bacterium]